MTSAVKKIKYLHLKGIALVAGTCLGAGMIGIPVKTAGAGFYPTIIAFLLVWVIMTASALLFLEVVLSFDKAVSFISMTDTVFGKIGKNIAWIVCLLFMYSVMAAYVSGGGALVKEFSILNFHKDYLASIVFMLPFAIMTYAGAEWIGFFNRLLILGTITSFVALCYNLINASYTANNTSVVSSNLASICDVKLLLKSLPLIVITIGYHDIIPSLKSYLKKSVVSLLMAILIGSLIPLIIYIVWQFLVVMLLPSSEMSILNQMLSTNINPSNGLIEYIANRYNNPRIMIWFSWFAFFAFTGSLTGTALALFDFLADGLKIVKNRSSKLFLIVVTFVPPIIYAGMFANGFLKALSLAGAFSAIIMIIYPVIMAWKIRMHKKNNHVDKDSKDLRSCDQLIISDSLYKAPLGFMSMVIIFLFGIGIILIEIINNTR